MKRTLSILLTIAVPILMIHFVFTGFARAQRSESTLFQAGAPTVVSYQGLVTIDGTAYDGTGYFKFAVIDETGTTTYWSNDGTSSSGGEPTSPVSLNVNQGLFDVLLGDTSLAGMTQELGASTFEGTDRYLRVWFSSDQVTFAQLSPDQRIAAVPYALHAEEVRNAWHLDGNEGTVPGTHFLGTSDEVSLTLAVGGVPALRLEPTAGTPNLVGGYADNYASSGVQGAAIAGGGSSTAINRVTDNFGVVGGGQNNQAGSDDGTLNNGAFSVVGGGHGNVASGQEAIVTGGFGNSASDEETVVVGGSQNTASGLRAFVGSGNQNNANGNYGFIGNGYLNSTETITNYATIVNGNQNTAGGQFSFIGNGYRNNALGFRSAIVNGETNTTHDWFDFIANGDSHEVWGRYSSIGGGYDNTISKTMSVIGGGAYNLSDGSYSTISGGRGNTASAAQATVPGGYNAAATHYGEMAYASGSFDERGDAQTSTYVLRRTSSGTTQVQLFLDPSTDQQITLPVGRVITFDILITAAADNGDAASYQYVGGIKHSEGGGTALIGSPIERMALEDDPSWLVTIDADTSNDALRIRVTGATGRTIHWVATVRTVETVMP